MNRERQNKIRASPVSPPHLQTEKHETVFKLQKHTKPLDEQNLFFSSSQRSFCFPDKNPIRLWQNKNLFIIIIMMMMYFFLVYRCVGLLVCPLSLPSHAVSTSSTAHYESRPETETLMRVEYIVAVQTHFSPVPDYTVWIIVLICGGL